MRYKDHLIMKDHKIKTQSQLLNTMFCCIHLLYHSTLTNSKLIGKKRNPTIPSEVFLRSCGNHSDMTGSSQHFRPQRFFSQTKLQKPWWRTHPQTIAQMTCEHLNCLHICTVAYLHKPFRGLRVFGGTQGFFFFVGSVAKRKKKKKT